MHITTPDVRELFEIDGRSYEAVKFIPPAKLLSWDKSGKVNGSNWTGMSGGNTDVLRVLKLEDIEFTVLKSMKVFNVISDEVKHNLENHIHIVRDEVSDRMEKAQAARKERKSKYENIPEEIACSVCKNMVESVPSKIAAICNKKEILLTDYLSNFKCKKCAGPVHRGRAPNPEFEDLPETAKCSCGFEVKPNFYQLKAKAEKLGVTIKSLIENYKCQKCVPTKGRPKKDS